MSKIFISLLGISFVALMLFYFYTSSSYKTSIEAKLYYTLGDYEESYRLATTAYKDDKYNRMALTVMQQSKFSLNFIAYIKEAQEYLDKINKIAEQKNINIKDKLKVKMMCSYMIEKYHTLKGSVLIESNLQKQSNGVYQKFIDLRQKVEESLKP